MNYLLDLDTVSVLSEPTSPYHETAKHHVKRLSEEDKIYLSVLSIYELRYSLSNTEDEEKKGDILLLVQWCKNFFEILPLSEAGAAFYGELKTGLKNRTGMNRKAIKKHNIDIMLAATALDRDCVLVAKDGIYKNHLALLNPRLRTEDWTQ